jgi:hypothetical protein
MMMFKGFHHFQLWSKLNVTIIKLVLILLIVLVSQGCAGQAKKEPAKTVTVPEPVPVVAVISEEVFRLDDRVVEVPIIWSKDSKDLYYLTYQHDKALPWEIWRFDGENKVRVAYSKYREEYMDYHLGVSVNRPLWLPARDLLVFLVEFQWGAFRQLAILNVKTGEIQVIDNIYDFDWHPTADKLVLVKLVGSLTEPPYHKTIAMAYDLAKDKLTEWPGVPKDILAIAFDKNGSIYAANYLAEMESQHVFQVFRIDPNGNKQYLWSIRGLYLELGNHLLPSLDRSRIALITRFLYQGTTIAVHDVTKQETKEVFQGYVKEVIRGDVQEFFGITFREVSWGEGNTLQLVISEISEERENWGDKILLLAGEDSITVEAVFPSAPPADNRKHHIFPSTLAPDNRRFLAEDFEHPVIDIVELY